MTQPEPALPLDAEPEHEPAMGKLEPAVRDPEHPTVPEQPRELQAEMSAADSTGGGDGGAAVEADGLSAPTGAAVAPVATVFRAKSRAEHTLGLSIASVLRAIATGESAIPEGTPPHAATTNRDVAVVR
jgi:hypothetical protein